MPLYYLSAAVAITGAIGYHILVRKVPATIDPIVSMIGINAGVLVVALLLLPFMSKAPVMTSVKQFGWVQLGLAICVAMMEWGFMLMYRSGWNLSIGNVVTGVVINLGLMGVGVFVLREGLNRVNVIGILLSIAGVAMISYRGRPLDGAASPAGAAEIAEAPSLDPGEGGEPAPTD